MNNSLFDTKVVQLISMLLCIIVVVCFFVYRYSKGADIQESKAKIQKLHTFYISGILVFIIIELVTGICMGNVKHNEILNYVNFAATLSSLIMSVVAIIFTIVTSSRGEEQYRKIDNASDKVTDSLNKFTEKTLDIDTSVSVFRDLSSDLSSKMDYLLKEMGSMHSDFSLLKKQLEPQLQTVSTPMDTKGKDALHSAVKTVSSRFVKIGSFSGNLALYACILAKETGKSSFSIQSITNQDNVSYMFGYLVAAVAAGIIDGQIAPDNCSITGVYDGLKLLVGDAIEAFINKQQDNNVKEQLSQAKQKVEDLFNND